MGSGIRRLALSKRQRARLTTGISQFKGGGMGKSRERDFQRGINLKGEMGLGRRGTVTVTKIPTRPREKLQRTIRKTAAQKAIDVVSHVSGSPVARGVGRVARFTTGALLTAGGAYPAGHAILTKEDREWARKVGEKSKKKFKKR